MGISIIPDGVEELAIKTAVDAINREYEMNTDIQAEYDIPKSAMAGSRIDNLLGYDVQYDAGKILDYVEKNAQNPSKKNLLITEKPLTFQNKNYVFGLSYLEGNIGVFSTHKLRQENNKFRSRVKKQAIKQVGYMLGMTHCENNRCVMHQTDVCRDLDATETTFCGSCQQSLLSKIDTHTSDTRVYDHDEPSSTDTQIYDPD